MLTKTDLSQIRKVVKDEIQEEVYSLKIDMKSLRNDMAKVKKDIDVIVSFFDQENIRLMKRVERIEEYLKIKPPPTLIP